MRVLNMRVTPRGGSRSFLRSGFLRPGFLCLLLCVCPVLVLATGCAAVDKTVARAAVGYLQDGALVFQREPDPQLAREAIPANFKLLEILLYRNPHDAALNALAAQYIATYAYAFVEPDAELLELTDPAAAQAAKVRASAFYLRGKAYGLQALARRKAFSAGLTGTPEAFEKGLKTLTRADLPALFWTAFCWGSYVNLNLDQPEALADSGQVSALMAKAMALDEGYYYGGAHLFFGALLSRLPVSAGGNPVESRQHFERALELSQGKLLMTKVFFARYYAVRIQDRALFVKTLEDVVAANVQAHPDEMLANLEAQRRAHYYLEQVNEYFLEVESPPSEAPRQEPP